MNVGHPGLLISITLTLTLTLVACDRAGAKPARLTPTTKVTAPPAWSPPGVLTFNPEDRSGADRLKLGDTIGALTGPGLKAPLPIPLMMRLDERDDRCGVDPPQVQALWLPEQRVLVIEQDVMCGEAVCKIWDVAAQRWDVDERCPEGPTAQFMLAHMSEDMFFLYGYTEGPGQGQVIRWSQGAPQRDLLTYISSPEAPVKTPKGWIFESVCNPASGQVAGVVDPADAECQPQDGCGYCVMTYAQPVRWLWQPGLPPQQLGDQPSATSPATSPHP